MLYPLSYRSKGGIWHGWRDSNPQPTVLETVALPVELHPYDWFDRMAFYPVSGFSCQKKPAIMVGADGFEPPWDTSPSALQADVFSRSTTRPLKIWSGRSGSNRRPTAWKAVALPTELHPHEFNMAAPCRGFRQTNRARRSLKKYAASSGLEGVSAPKRDGSSGWCLKAQRSRRVRPTRCRADSCG